MQKFCAAAVAAAAVLSGGGGSPQGLLHLLPGLGLHWYVHSTLTRVSYDVTLPGGQGRLTGKGWAHVEKNWGGRYGRPTHALRGVLSSWLRLLGGGGEGR